MFAPIACPCLVRNLLLVYMYCNANKHTRSFHTQARMARCIFSLFGLSAFRNRYFQFGSPWHHTIRLASIMHGFSSKNLVCSSSFVCFYYLWFALYCFFLFSIDLQCMVFLTNFRFHFYLKKSFLCCILVVKHHGWICRHTHLCGFHICR